MIWCIADKMKFVSFYCTQLIITVPNVSMRCVVVFADFWLKYRVNSLFLHSVATFWTIGRQIIHNYTNTIFEYYSDANWFWILAFEAFWIYQFIQWIWTWKKSISNLRINIDIQRWVTFISQNKFMTIEMCPWNTKSLSFYLFVTHMDEMSAFDALKGHMN